MQGVKLLLLACIYWLCLQKNYACTSHQGNYNCVAQGNDMQQKVVNCLDHSDMHMIELLVLM